MSLWLMDGDGSSPERLIAGGVESLTWFPSSEELAFSRRPDAGPLGVHAVSLSDGGARFLVSGEYLVWSPDGSRIAYFGIDWLRR